MPENKSMAGALMKPIYVTQPWREELTMSHLEGRNHSVSTLQYGIDAFERYIRTTKIASERRLYLAMVAGNADASAVVDLYRREILKKKKDNPPTVPLEGNGFIVKTGLGNIAMVPRSDLWKVDSKLAGLIILDDRRFEDGDVPRFLWPSAKYFAGSEQRSWHTLADAGTVAQAGAMQLFFDARNSSFTVRSFNDKYGTFSLIDHFTDRIRNIHDAQEYLKAWKAHAEELIAESVRAAAALRSEMERDTSLASPKEDGELKTDRPEDYTRHVRKLTAFITASHQAFMKASPLLETWEYDFIHDQGAKLNNAAVPVNIANTFQSFEELLHTDIQWAIDAMENLIDPVDHIEKVYMTKRASRWIDVVFQDGKPERFEGVKSPELRFLIDEIVYHAGKPDDEGGKAPFESSTGDGSDDMKSDKRIAFSFDEIGMTVFDKSGGKALAPFLNSELKEVLRGLVERMGPDAGIDFLEEQFADGNIILGIDIRLPREDGTTPAGGGEIGGGMRGTPVPANEDGGGGAIMSREAVNEGADAPFVLAEGYSVMLGEASMAVAASTPLPIPGSGF